LNQFAARRRRPRGGVRPRLALASGSSICERLRRQRDRARHAVSASVTETPALSRSVRTLLMTSSSLGASADSTSPSGSIQIPKSGRMLRKALTMNSTPATSRTHRSAGRRSFKDYSLHTARPSVDHPPEQPLATLRRGLARRRSGIGGLGAVQSLAEDKKRLRQFKRRRLHPGGLAPLLR